MGDRQHEHGNACRIGGYDLLDRRPMVDGQRDSTIVVWLVRNIAGHDPYSARRFCDTVSCYMVLVQRFGRVGVSLVARGHGLYAFLWSTAGDFGYVAFGHVGWASYGAGILDRGPHH